MKNKFLKNIRLLKRLIKRFFRQSDYPILQSSVFNIVFFIASLFLPFSSASAQERPSHNLSNGFIYLNNYIASSKFGKMKNETDNLALIDSIWNESVRYFDGDISEALLAATFATLPFDKMPLKLPFGLKMDLLLPSPGDSLFKAKLKNLPSGFLIDSPKGKNSDTDKIAHFFGNAFLSYNISWIHLSDFLGLFVETFEKSFKVNGALDIRDLAINRFGSAFGKALNENRNLAPSQFFEGYNAFNLFMRYPIAITQ